MSTSKSLKASVPWYFKIAAKLLLARLPLPYGIWKRLGVFDNGPMEHAAYAMGVFKSHFQAGTVPDSFTCLELGPGDSVLSALLARAHGARRIYLVDVGRFASNDCGAYRNAARDLKSSGYDVPTEFTSVAEMLELCGAEYMSAGIASLATIPNESIDFIWSQAVLEHVRREQFVPVVAALRRIIKPTGFASHSVDLKDHFNDALNNLRFSDRVWESKLFRTSGFYTNRIRRREMLDIFSQQGFIASVTREIRWDRLPTQRAALASRFRKMTDEELLTSSFSALLRPAPMPSRP